MTQAMDATLAALVISALRALVLAGIAGLGLTVFGTRSTSVRLFVWRSVLVSALAMPFLGQVLPPLWIPTPEFHRSAAIQSTSHPIPASSPLAFAASGTQQTKSGTSDSSPTFVDAAKPAMRPTSASHFGSSAIPWNSLLVAIYLIVASIFFVRLIVGFALTQRLIGASRHIADPRLGPVLVSHPEISNTPLVRESSAISVPVTVGAFRSAILLPRCWREWDDWKLNAVMAHEISHVSRRDALVQFVCLLHRAIFWFSPLAWWLDRRLATLAEEASDEAALSGGADRNDYAKTLLAFFESLQRSPGRVWWQGVSMAQQGQAEQRLEKILAFRGSINMKTSLVVSLIIVSVPAVYLVASARPASPAASSRQQSQAPAAVPVPPAAVAPALADSSVASSDSGQADDHKYSYAYGDDDEDRFIIVSGKSDSFTMSGSMQDIHHVERLKKEIPGDFIWFQRDEKSYIIRDQATIDRAKAFWAPQAELGKKQEALGKQQEALGKQQEALGKKMEEVRVAVPSDLTAKLDSLKARLQKLGPSATMEQMGDLQSEIGELQSQIGDIQGRAGEQQGKFGEEQGRLGEQQGKLGEEQGKLGEEQGRLAEEAAKKMKSLLDEEIKNGKAQPEADGSHGASL